VKEEGGRGRMGAPYLPEKQILFLKNFYFSFHD
jgi:hypothetical protein